MPSFIKIVLMIKKLNSISRAPLNFRRRPFCVQLCIETSCKRATSVAHLTNFSFEFFMKFSQKMPLHLFYIRVQKSQKWPKAQIKGSCIKKERTVNEVLRLSIGKRKKGGEVVKGYWHSLRNLLINGQLRALWLVFPGIWGYKRDSHLK